MVFSTAQAKLAGELERLADTAANALGAVIGPGVGAVVILCVEDRAPDGTMLGSFMQGRAVNATPLGEVMMLSSALQGLSATAPEMPTALADLVLVKPREPAQ